MRSICSATPLSHTDLHSELFADTDRDHNGIAERDGDKRAGANEYRPQRDGDASTEYAHSHGNEHADKYVHTDTSTNWSSVHDRFAMCLRPLHRRRVL